MHGFMKSLRKNQKGFTLIELLVVVAIIGLLAAFAVPKLFEAINKAKAAPGNSDMNAVSGALERFYLDSDTSIYPSGTDTQVMTALRSGYLKGTTSFTNGYKQGYVYGVVVGHKGYILLDLQGETGVTQIQCGGTPYTFTVSTGGLSVLTSEITQAHFTAGCTQPAGTKLMTN